MGNMVQIFISSDLARQREREKEKEKGEEVSQLVTYELLIPCAFSSRKGDAEPLSTIAGVFLLVYKIRIYTSS